MKLYIVGQNPSIKNWHAEIPFWGSPSGVRLRRLLNYVGLGDTEYSLINAAPNWYQRTPPPASAIDLPEDIKTAAAICLGRVAEKYVLRSGCKHVICIPHPSPRNRVWNERNAEHKAQYAIASFLRSINVEQQPPPQTHKLSRDKTGPF